MPHYLVTVQAPGQNACLEVEVEAENEDEAIEEAEEKLEFDAMLLDEETDEDTQRRPL